MQIRSRFARALSGRLPAGLALGPILGLVGAVSLAHADSLQVSPIAVDFKPAEQAQALYLVNNGKRPMEAQVRVLQWTQTQHKDELDPTNDIVASPAIIRIAPGDRQLVRLVRRQVAAPSQELSYRVLVDQLPDKQAPDHSGVTILLRYSVPVFVASATAPLPASSTGGPLPETDLSPIHAQLLAGPNGTSELRVRNDGPIHIRLAHLGMTSPGGQGTDIVDGLVGYVLPGQQMSWPVNVPYPLPAGQILKARFNDDREAHPVPLDHASR